MTNDYSSFMFLDIGETNVRGIAFTVRGGNATKSATTCIPNTDTTFAIKSVADDLERQTGERFEGVFITGNFGCGAFKIKQFQKNWETNHKITEDDLREMVSKIQAGDDFYPAHIIPLRYDTDAAHNINTPVGAVAKNLSAVFGALFYERERTADLMAAMRAAHLMTRGVFDSAFLVNGTNPIDNGTQILIDFGGQSCTVSIWGARGPMFFEKLDMGQNKITDDMMSVLDISRDDAMRIKHSVANANSDSMDRFTPADIAFGFTRANVGDIVIPILNDIANRILDAAADAIEKYRPTRIILYGGGACLGGIDEMVSDAFGMPVKNLGADGAVNALAEFIWHSAAPHIAKHKSKSDRWKKFFSSVIHHQSSITKSKKTKVKKFIPIMPSSLAFDMSDPNTYSLFKSANISMIHVDVMDGFFVDRIVGGMDQLRYIRDNTNAHLHVHLMTESPATWAADAAANGADTIIVSTNTAGVRNALRKIREMGKRCGIALNPESDAAILKPVLKELDEVLIMSVRPGAGGQKFDENVLQKISVLAGTRKKYGLKFKISIDGGINPDTAKLCWAAGADFLISGSYLANADDFPLAVQSLISN